MAMIADSIRAPSAGWLRNRDFDLLLIVGLVAAAMLAGVVITLQPAAVGLVLLADSWLLGYPHVVATFSRLVPDKESLARYRFLVFGLPVAVVATTAALTAIFGFVLIATIYFYWQWYHTMRQSWGVAQLYRRQSPVPVREPVGSAEALFSLVAAWGLLHRMSAAPEYFLNATLPLWLPPVPVWFADGVGVMAIAGLLWWSAARIREAISGQLPVVHTLFSASHYLIFIVGYVVMDDIVGGWVVTNIWHTGQYLMLVWLFNEKACAKAVSKGWFFRLTRDNRPARYFAFCMILALPVYFLLTQNFFWGPAGLVVALVLNQTLNFHHFIVDAVIWRRRSMPAGAPTP